MYSLRRATRVALSVLSLAACTGGMDIQSVPVSVRLETLPVTVDSTARRVTVPYRIQNNGQQSVWIEPCGAVGFEVLLRGLPVVVNGPVCTLIGAPPVEIARGAVITGTTTTDWVVGAFYRSRLIVALSSSADAQREIVQGSNFTLP